MKEPGRLQSMGSRRVGQDWATSLSFSLSCIGEGNSNPLKCSCLENPRDGGAWWAAVYGVAQSNWATKQQQHNQFYYCFVTKSCPTHCDPMDCSPSGSYVYGISQAKILGCHFLLQCMKVKSEGEVAQWYPTPSDAMGCSLPGSSVHGICQARVLEWGAIFS